MVRCGVLLVGEESISRRGIPWGTVALVAVAVVGVGSGSGASTDPRNFVGSSGATYVPAATPAAALVLRSVAPDASGRRDDRLRRLGLAVPAGFVLGLAVEAVVGRLGASTAVSGRPPRRTGRTGR